MPCGWEGNRRSGVALAMRHRLQWFIQLRAHGLDREMSTPPTLLTRHDTLYLHLFIADIVNALKSSIVLCYNINKLTYLFTQTDRASKLLHGCARLTRMTLNDVSRL